MTVLHSSHNIEAMDKRRSLVILTATYNDKESLQEWLRQLDRELARAALCGSVVIIDDGSRIPVDGSMLTAAPLSAVEEITIITLARNLGHQRALATGIGYIADKIQCDCLVVMDSDMEDLPAHVPQLVNAANETKDRIIFAARTRRSEGLLFKGFYLLYQYLYRALTGTSIAVGNFSAVPGRLIARVARVSEIWSHIAAGVMRARIPFRTIPAPRGQRLHGKSRMNFSALVIHGLSAIAVHADVVGVRIILSLIIAGGTLLLMIGAVVLKRLVFDFFIWGWTSMVVIVLGLSVFQTLFAAAVMAFLILAGRNQMTVIPVRDYVHFVLDVSRVLPAKHAAIPRTPSIPA